MAENSEFIKLITYCYSNKYILPLQPQQTYQLYWGWMLALAPLLQVQNENHFVHCPMCKGPLRIPLALGGYF